MYSYPTSPSIPSNVFFILRIILPVLGFRESSGAGRLEGKIFDLSGILSDSVEAYSLNLQTLPQS